MKEREFVRTCKKVFAHLTKAYDLSVIASGGDQTSAFVRIANSKAGIECRWDARDGGVFVTIARLSDGQFPDEPVFIRKNTPINSFFVDNVIILRGGQQALPRINPIMTATEIVAALAIYAKLIEKYAADVLSGDFKIFTEVEKIIKARKKELDKQQL